MGKVEIDPRQFPGEPWLYRLIQQLAQRVNGIINHYLCRDKDGPYYRTYGVVAENLTDEEIARVWEQVRAEHRSSPRWSAGQRRKRRRP